MPAEPVLPESELRSRARQCIEDGRLPVMLSTDIYAGDGTGELCELCDLPIAADKLEYDITDPDSGKTLHFHIACHFVWQRECASRLKHSLSRSTPSSEDAPSYVDVWPAAD